MYLFHYTAEQEGVQVSNEELALLIQQGEKEHTSQLWNQIERFIEMKARQYERHLSGCDADVEDLRQSGYFAMLEAVEYYRPEKGYKYITYLDFTLRKAFGKVAGIRSSRRDAAKLAYSLDSPVSKENDKDSLLAFVEDEQAQAPFQEIERADYTVFAKDAILNALKPLNDKAQRLMYLIFYEHKTITEAASIIGYSSKQTAETAHYNALRKLRKSSTANELREIMFDFGDFDIYSEGLKGTGFISFKETQQSATERTAIMMISREGKTNDE